jgi:RND superfamily putative drug exporter
MPRPVTTAARRHPVLVIVAWLVIAGAGLAAGNGVFSRLTTAVGTVPGSESDRAAAVLDRSGLQPPAVMAVISGRVPAAQVPAAVRDILAMPGVAAVRPRPAGAAQAGRGPLLLGIRLRPQLDGQTAGSVARRLQRLGAGRVIVAGGPLTDGEFTQQAASDTHRAEIIALPLLLVLLLLVFGSLAAAVLPLLVAVAGICATLGLLLGFSHLTSVSVFAIPVTTMLSAGLAVDYSLMMVKRYQEERARPGGGDPDDALDRAQASAGRTILFSGLTVSVSLAGLLVFPDPFLRSLGMAGAAVVLADMLAALTLLPALLAVTGRRIPVRRPSSRRPRPAGGLIAVITSAVQRRPLTVLVVAAGLLATLALPAFGMRLTTGDPRSLPVSSPTRQLAQALAEHFPALGGPDPITIVARAAPAPAVRAFSAAVARVPGVTAVQAAGSAAGITVLQAEPAQPDDSGLTALAVTRIRHLAAPFPVAVTGLAARLVDYRASIRSRALWAAGLVILATFILLFAFTGSVVLPLKAAVTNLLGLAAGLGTVVWVFQDGHLRGLLGTPDLGAVDLTVPVVVAAIAFGLATDYEVFMLSRVREQWLAGAPPRAAVAAGVRSSAGIILAAALMLAVAFAGFLAAGFAPIKEVGVGLVAAVTLDALVVRMLLVPALLTRLGAIAWAVPGPLLRLRLHPEPGPPAGGAGAAATDEAPAWS